MCPDGQVLDPENDKCVPKTECPRCPKNEEWSDCANECSRKCNDYYISGNFCTLDCRPGCTCKVGFVRDTCTNKCIEPGNCTCEPCCGLNEIFNPCGECLRTCDQPTAGCPEICLPMGKCECQEGYVRDIEWNCILVQDCFNEKRRMEKLRNKLNRFEISYLIDNGTMVDGGAR